MGRFVLVLSTVALLSALAGFTMVQRHIEAPLSLPSQGGVMEVRAGDNLRTVLRRLVEQEWLVYPRIVEWWARYRRLDSGLQVGEYRLSAGTTPRLLLEQLSRGEVIQYSVTLPEGITLAEAITRLHAEPALAQTLSSPADASLLALVSPHASAEGWFLPETYRYTRGDSDLDILRRAHSAMTNTLERVWNGRSLNLPLSDPYQALILASIVERETSVGSERAKIAGVFIRRLEQGMRLQTDPTIIYGLGDRYDGNITRSHLKDKSNLWNTYVIRGLPPTPIALPGVAALTAAVQPEPGDELYFVARGDGYHVFAPDLKTHRANVKRYQLQRVEQYRSTPAESQN